MKKIILIMSLLFFTSAYAGMSDNDKSKAWECSGIYMANYFLPSIANTIPNGAERVNKVAQTLY